MRPVLPRQMRMAILALTLMVASSQTVGWVECCCVLICKHHNDPCKDECTAEKKRASSHECCEHPAPQAPRHQHEKRCSHVEPSSEIVSQVAELPSDAPVLSVELPGLPLPVVPSEEVRSDLRSDAPRGSPPLLHLLFGTLLI